MKPYYENEAAGVKLYCGDCREVLPGLESGTIDAVITDPPYGNNYSTGRRLGINRYSTKITGDLLSRPLLNDTAALLEPLLNDTAAIYWFAAPDRLDMVLPILKRWEVVNVLCWDKGNCTAGDLDCSYGKQWEACVYAVTRKSKLIGARDRDILRFPRGSTVDYVHPTQKPVELFSYLTGRHASKQILDPFAGSGTTGVACVRLGRKFTGIEIDERYAETSAKRIQTEIEKGRLFEPAELEAPRQHTLATTD